MATLQRAIEQVGSRLVMGFEWLETGVTFNPVDPRNQADPYPMYDRVRERDPLHRSRPVGGWVFTRYRDVLAALRDLRFSSDERGTRGYERNRRRLMDAGVLPEDDVDTPPILGLDPPDHTRIRALMSKAFTRRSVERLRPRVDALVNELLEKYHGVKDTNRRAEKHVARAEAAIAPFPDCNAKEAMLSAVRYSVSRDR